MSIVKIAKKAGVGIGTVSRYMNDNSKVSASSASKIADAIAETGYRLRVRRPGPKNRERVGIRTGVVLFLAIGRFAPERMITMPAFPLLISGIQRSLMKRGISLMFANSTDTHPVPDMIDEKFCDGVIVESIGQKSMNEQLREKLKSMPAVWCFREHCDYNHDFDHILYNNAAVGAIAARYMHENGHRKVAFLSSNSIHEAFLQRQDVFVKNCAELGIETVCIASSLPEETTTGVNSAYITEQFMRKRDGVTGIFFCSDDLMLGVYNELRARGFDLSHLDMLGCNNEEQFLGHISPRPATIDIRLMEMGEQIVTRLLSRINGSETGSPVELLINPKLIPAEKNR